MAEMEQKDLREEQIEALGVLAEYSTNLIKCMKTSIKELRGEKLEDTYEFLRKVLDGVNWELQVLNGCMSLINEKETLISKEDINPAIEELNKAYQAKNDAAIAAVLDEKLLPFIEKLTEIALSYQK